MRRVLSSTVTLCQPARAFGTFLGASSAALQRGGTGQGGGARYGGGSSPQRGGGSNQQGFGNRQQGYDRQQGYNNRQQGYDHRQQGYDNRQQGYDRQQGYNNRQQGYDNRQQGYDGQQGYDNRRRGPNDRPQGNGNRRGDNGPRPHGGSSDRPPRRSASDYLQRDAETLLQMKQAYKASKTAKERQQIRAEARLLSRKVRVDASSQDERSIMTFLNCAVIFRFRPYDSVEGALQWVLANVRGLSPHNIALYANALGVLEVENRKEMFEAGVVSVLPSVMGELTPVEVVMVLQAFQRLHVMEHDELKDRLLLQLEPCIATMPVQQLSTLATILQRHHLRDTNTEKWHELVQLVMRRAMESVTTMHSNEAITFLEAAPRLNLPPEQMCALLARATATAGFHDDKQVAYLLETLAHTHKAYPEPTPELSAAVAGLQAALLARFEKVAPFVRPASAAIIWRYSAQAGTPLPAAMVQAMSEVLVGHLTYRFHPIAVVSRLAEGAAALERPPSQLLNALAKLAVGERLPRPHGDAAPAPHEEDAEGREDVEGVRASSRELFFQRSFTTLVSTRLDLEDAYAKCGAAPPVELTNVLPEILLLQVSNTSPKRLVQAVWAILLRPPGCPLRNVANDEAIFAAVLKDIRSTPEKYKEGIKPRMLERMSAALSGTANGAEMVEALQRAMN